MQKIVVDSSILGKHFLKCHNLKPGQKLQANRVDPTSLLSHNRIDLVPKINYALQYLDGNISNLTIQHYKAIIRAFSLGKFKEPGQESTKYSFEKYLSSFETLINKTKRSGFQPKISVVPVGAEGLLLDGSHRVATCIALKQEIYIVKIKCKEAKYNPRFFEKRFVQSASIDSIIDSYMEKVKTHRSLLIWPFLMNKHENQIRSFLEKYREQIIYTKSMTLTKKGVCSLIVQVYENEDWIGTPKNKFRGAWSKAKSVLSKTSSGKIERQQKLLLVIFDDPNSYLAAKAKSELRSLYDCKNDGCHSTDSAPESRSIAGIFLRAGSVNILNSGKFLNYELYIKKLIDLRSEIIAARGSLDDYILVSSSILGIHGLRRPNDIDYLTVDAHNDRNLISGDSHTHVTNNYGHSILQLISDSNNNEYLFGLKFLSLDLLYKGNQFRREYTKKIDMLLIELHGKAVQQPGLYILRVTGAYFRFIRSAKRGLAITTKKLMKIL